MIINKVNKDKYDINLVRNGSRYIYSKLYQWTIVETTVTKTNIEIDKLSKINSICTFNKPELIHEPRFNKKETLSDVNLKKVIKDINVNNVEWQNDKIELPFIPTDWPKNDKKRKLASGMNKIRETKLNIS